MNDSVAVKEFEMENIFDLVNTCVKVNANERVKTYEIEYGIEYVKRLDLEKRRDFVKAIELVK